MALPESQESQLSNLAEIVTEMMKRIDDQELRNKTMQTQNSLEVQALKRRMEDLQNQTIKDAKTIREEYDAAVDSLGSLMEDVARRVTKAVQHYEERFTSDLEKLREHVTKTINTQSTVLTQKIDAALAEKTRQDGDREGESEDANSGTASTAKMARNTDVIMRRIESMAHMLRAEALAQSQAFEAKLASVEAGHSAETKRLQGMLQSSYCQLQGLQRSISAMECGLFSKPQSPRQNSSLQQMVGSMKVPHRVNEPKEPKDSSEPTLREDLCNKLRNIQSSVTGVLTVLDSSANSATRGQSPNVKQRYNKSPVQLPINPAGTLEKQMRQKEYEGRASPLMSTLTEERRQSPGRCATTETRATHPAQMNGASNSNQASSRIPEPVPTKMMAQPPKSRQSHGPHGPHGPGPHGPLGGHGLVASMSQQAMPPMISGMSGGCMMPPGVYPMHARSGMGSPVAPMMAQAIPLNFAVKRKTQI